MGETSYTFRSGFQDRLVALNLGLLRLSPLWIRVAVFLAVWMPMVVCIIGGYFVGKSYDNPMDGSVAMTGFTVLGIVLARPVSDMAGRQVMNRLARLSVHDDVTATLIMDDSGVRWASRSVDVFIWWRAIDCVFLERGSLFFIAGPSVYAVPASSFPDDAARNAALESAMPRLTSAARVRSFSLRRK